MIWVSLSALRFILASIVAFSHLCWWFIPQNDSQILYMIKFSGMAAVASFLVISGYSIANSLERQQKQFYLRRFTRIMPLYVLATLFSFSLKFMIGGEGAASLFSQETFKYSSLKILFGNLIFLQGFFCEYIHTNPVVWTLSIEMFLYLLAPFIHKIANKNLILIAAYSSMLLWSVHKLLNKLELLNPDFIPLIELKFGGSLILLAWSWLIGYWFFFNKDKKWASAILLSSGTLTLFIQYPKNLIGISIYILTCLTIIYGDQLKLNKQTSNFLLLMGDISYPLAIKNCWFAYSISTDHRKL